MSSFGLDLGGIYQPDWDKRPFRVVGLDEHEVFYDCQWEHDGLWTFSGNFGRTCVFYRMPTALFATRSRRIGELPLTPEEMSAFRPDLPMRLDRSALLSWNKPWSADILDAVGSTHRLMARSVVLVPYGPKGGMKSGSIIASAGEGLELSTLLQEAKRIQETINGQTSNGIGLYRLGWQKRSPSYYIGEYIDRAGHVR